MLLLTAAALARPGPELDVRIARHAVVGRPIEVVVTVRQPDDERRWWDPARIQVRVTGADGTPAPDPSTWHAPSDDRSFVRDHRLRRVQRATFDLNDRAWLEAPGTWTVEVAWPHALLGAPSASTVVELRPDDHPEQARSAVELALVDPAVEPPVGWLGRPWAVPLLEENVGRSPEGAEDRATRALLAVPTVEASEALVRVLDSHADGPVRELLLGDLPARFRGGWLRDHAWTAELDAALLERARERLRRPVPLQDPRNDWRTAHREETFAAEVVGQLGDATDLALLTDRLRDGRGPGTEALVEAVVRLGGPSALPEDGLVAALGGLAPERAVAILLDRLSAGGSPEREGALLLGYLNTGACESFEPAEVHASDLEPVVRSWRAAMAERTDELAAGAILFDPAEDPGLVPAGAVCAPWLREGPRTPFEPPAERPAPGPTRPSRSCYPDPIPVVDDEVVLGVTVDALAAALDGRILGTWPLTPRDGATTDLTLTLEVRRGTGAELLERPSDEVCRRTSIPAVMEQPRAALLVEVAGTLRTADGLLDERFTGTLEARAAGNAYRWRLDAELTELSGTLDLRTFEDTPEEVVSAKLVVYASGQGGRLEGVQLTAETRTADYVAVAYFASTSPR